MTRPRLLDLYCGAGGAAMGYYRAGFDIVGVDIEPQPHYPFAFVQADAMTFPLDGFDVIHASPPCHDHSPLRYPTGRSHGTGWQLGAMLDRLRAQPRPWVVENVDSADLGNAWSVICGSSLGLSIETPDGPRWLRRHRRFACSHTLIVPPCCCHPSRPAIGVYGHANQRTGRGYKGTMLEAGAVMGIEWMTQRELSQAIPPAYAQLIGEQLLAALPSPPRHPTPCAVCSRLCDGDVCEPCQRAGLSAPTLFDVGGGT